MADVPVRFAVEMPVQSRPGRTEWIDPGNIVAFAQAAESAGIDSIAFTDHPAPSEEWLRSGGHESFDPFVALAFCAAVTSRLRLMTRLVVLPYRNPLVTAKSMATLDVLSAGRTIFVVGTGYLRSEFDAVGVRFDERNELFDEAVEALVGVWTGDGLTLEGRDFVAAGQVCRPRAIQQPSPPLWLGGNARVVLDRVVRYGQGWSPLQGDPAMAASTRTPVFASLEQLGASIAELHRRLEQAGRDPLEVRVLAGTVEADLRGETSAAEHLDRIGQLCGFGVTDVMVRIPRHDIAHTLERMQWFGETVIQPMRCRVP